MDNLKCSWMARISRSQGSLTVRKIFLRSKLCASTVIGGLVLNVFQASVCQTFVEGSIILDYRYEARYFSR